MSLPDWGFTQWLLFAMLAGIVLLLLKGIRFIPNNKVGIVEMLMRAKIRDGMKDRQG
jgi:regulator of protease activity HflC (stomatin/prohibitin superfamily)